MCLINISRYPYVITVTHFSGKVELFDEEGNIKEPPEDLDYFTLFGLEKAFALDTAHLAKGL